MQGYVELAEIKEEPRFGDITVLFNPLNPAQRVMRTMKRSGSLEEFHAINEQVQERQRINSPYIMTLLHIETDETRLETLVYFEYPEDRLRDESLQPAEAVKLFVNILEAICFLQSHKMIHGDIRPEYISFVAEAARYKLMDRLSDLSPPLQCQLNNINHLRPLYMAPLIFDELANKARKIKQNSYKSELFSIGLIALGAFRHPETVQEFYNVDEKGFEAAAFAAFLEELEAEQEEPVACAFLAFLREDVLEVDEKKRLNPKRALAKLRETPLLQRFLDGGEEEAPAATPVKFYDPFDFVAVGTRVAVEAPPAPAVAAEREVVRVHEGVMVDSFAQEKTLIVVGPAPSPPEPALAAMPPEQPDTPREDVVEEPSPLSTDCDSFPQESREEFLFEFVEIPRTASTDMLDYFQQLGIDCAGESVDSDARLASKIKKSQHLSAFREELVTADPAPQQLSRLSDLFRLKISAGAREDARSGAQTPLAGEERRGGEALAAGAPRGGPKSIGKAGSFAFFHAAPRAAPESKPRFEPQIEENYQLSCSGAAARAEPLPPVPEQRREQAPSRPAKPASAADLRPAPQGGKAGFGSVSMGCLLQDNREDESSLKELLRKSVCEERQTTVTPSMNSGSNTRIASRSPVPRATSSPSFSARSTVAEPAMERETLTPLNISICVPFETHRETVEFGLTAQSPRVVEESRRGAFRNAQAGNAVELLAAPPAGSPRLPPAMLTSIIAAQPEEPRAVSPVRVVTRALAAEPNPLKQSLHKSNVTKRISAFKTRGESVTDIVKELTSPPRTAPLAAEPAAQTPYFVPQAGKGPVQRVFHPEATARETRQNLLPAFAEPTTQRAATPLELSAPRAPRAVRPQLRGTPEQAPTRPLMMKEATPLRYDVTPKISPQVTRSPAQHRGPAQPISEFRESKEEPRWVYSQPVATGRARVLPAAEERKVGYSAAGYQTSSYLTTRSNVEFSPNSVPSFANYRSVTEHPPAALNAYPTHVSQVKTTYQTSQHFAVANPLGTQYLYAESHGRTMPESKLANTKWVDVYPAHK